MVGAAVVVGATVVVAAVVVVVLRGTVVDVVEVDVVVATPVLFGSSTNGSLGVGRPAIATPARPPTTITARTKGHDLRMRSVKLPANLVPAAALPMSSTGSLTSSG